MKDRMTAEEFLGLTAKGKSHKYRAQGGRDPETGEFIPSKLEARVLARKRMEADATNRIIALHPRIKIEGGHATLDGAEIEIVSTGALVFQAPSGRAGFVWEIASGGWFTARVRLWDAKSQGTNTAVSRKSRRQVKERTGIEVQIVTR